MLRRFRSGQSKSSSKDGSSKNVLAQKAGSVAPPTFINGSAAISAPSQNPQDLTLVHDPHEATADIIFVHGLGGSSWTTWCWKHDPSMFWPAWLQHEEGLSPFRVFTFGYNANWRGPNTTLSILDFARDLLVRMRGYGDAEPKRQTPIGKRPIIFVAHSMGGLVVKKAYILGKYDEHYANMTSHVHGIVFLSTPHRGSSHAGSLSNLLSVMVGTSNKVYVTELESNSTSIEDINAQFQSVGKALRLVSMYETLPTKVFPGIKKLIVGKDTGILNYPGEVSGPANADHHTICKYRNREDDNYMLLIAFLKQITQNLTSLTESHLVPRPLERVHILESILGIVESPTEDLNRFTSDGLPGSGEWLRRRKTFRHWLRESNGDIRFFCLTGLPGAGKSTLAAMTIRHLQEVCLGPSCQYHFFTDAQPTKKSLAYCLRSIASQVATTHGAFAERLLRLHQDVGDALSSDKYQTIWAKVFEGILFKIDLGYTLFWVFDAVDEAENPQMFLRLVSQIQSSSGIKVMLLSRPNKNIAGVVGRDNNGILDTITIEDTAQDIREYVRSVVTTTLPAESEIQTQIIDEIVTRTEGSFLWARLALNTLHDSWHTLADIQKAMDVIPKGMQSLYQKMLFGIRAQSQQLQDMARRILTWATCSFRPIKLTELQAVLEPEFGRFISLKDTIIQVCGHLVHIDGDSVSLIHATARTFLSSPDGDESVFVPWKDGHETLAKACLQYLSNDRWRRILSRVSETDSMHKDRLAMVYNTHPLLGYALKYWAYHVRHAPVTSSALLQHLEVFFSKHVLCWIQAVALSRSLPTLHLASQYIKVYLKERRTSGGNEARFLERWAVDLIKILGKFGNNLAENPSSVFKHIPPLCPIDSMISQIGAPKENTLIRVAGISTRMWDDSLARLSVGQDESADKVRSAGVYFLALNSSSGIVTIWSAETCEELRKIQHGEPVALLETNATGSAAATSGQFTFKIWNVFSGRLLRTITRPPGVRPVQVAFGDAETDFAVTYDNCVVVWYDIQSGTEVRRFTIEESSKLRGCPRLTALSPDQSRMAIAFKGRPVSVWETSGASDDPPRQCLRAVDGTRSGQSDPYSISQAAVWHPDGESLYIMYFDTVLVHWDLVKDETSEFDHTGARGMVISSDGALLLTYSFDGVLSVWGLPNFNLVYRLHGNDPGHDMAFSPDSCRIYSTKSSLCCVWEPDALIRPDDIDPDGNSVGGKDEESLASRAVSEPVYFHETSGAEVTALTYETGGEFYCCGREDGTVSIHDMKDGKTVRKVCSHEPYSVTILAWSPSGRFLVSGDELGTVIVKKLRIKEDETWAVYPVFETEISEEPVYCLLFSRDEQLLLISTFSGDQIWDLSTKSKICEKASEGDWDRKWINHPFDDTRLLVVEQNRIHIHSWQNLNDDFHHNIVAATLADDIRIFRPISTISFENIQALVDTKNRRYLVCQTSHWHKNRWSRDSRVKSLLSLLLVTNLQGVASASPQQVHRRPLFELSAHVQIFLGCHQSRIVFINQGNWVCTADVSWEENVPLNIRKHFFLPRDWLASEFVGPLIRLTEQGVLLVPRNGEVAIVTYEKGF